MTPSRRAVLGLFGTASIALVSGCSAARLTDGETSDGVETATGAERSDGTGTNDGAESDGTGTDAGATDARSFEMRLVGPDADRTLFTAAAVSTVGEVRAQNTGGYGVPVTLSDEATADVSETLRDVGVAASPDDYEFVLRYGGEEESRFGIAEGLAREIADGEWDGQFLLTLRDRSTAQELRESLVEG